VSPLGLGMDIPPLTLFALVFLAFSFSFMALS
jgi:hypothetical protein